ncbi:MULTISPECIES: GntR family transcriptional regulator [Marinovum]|jgi:DNA-binding GntR family transcriptional regulator|uniref:Transcriptional regulator, GntR family n=1 Tax=Marinovum algicola TaxID=42444 RepID=A0A975WCF4_9RHOB|nr:MULTISPECIES: GntR family transcriptional regulator [Marinovum]AKO99170.1 Transcriptional regulator [Marinovum algicola DG 898]MDD9739363.1 GntR family transcriptional regulator [Marinovum sp. SP66]MDD9746306.1 GntR family transcriptional regulator [Marinovum sp. PR37]SEJ90557.1 transcriptional regulator, GntR family [Marinovum algicola]SLN43108.1 HTH-type transcriptional regulator LutR [Marinovum algicola]
MSNVSNTLRIRESLENAIVDGRYVPGTKLDPIQLAEEFGCSRTPIREALQQLEASGLVRIHAKRGTFVSEWNVEELAERFEVMAELESTCARLAARRITNEELAELVSLHERCRRMAEDERYDDYYAENSAFHACIYTATHNSFLAQEALRLHAMLQPYRRIQLRVRNRMKRSYNEHEAVVCAIRNGDDSAASEAMRAHVLIQGDRFHDLVAALRTEPSVQQAIE